MRFTYDAEADAMYIYLQGASDEKVGHMQLLEDGVAVDFRADGAVVGIEILDASQRLGFPRGCPIVSLEHLAFKDSATTRQAQPLTDVEGLARIADAAGEATDSTKDFVAGGRAMKAKWIVADPEHLGGKPRVAGTRISIEFLLESLACGMSIREIVHAYPTLTEEATKGALEELAHSDRISVA